MKILVINSGSSSIKFQLINMENLQVLAKGLVERIGMTGFGPEHYQGDGYVLSNAIPDHAEAIDLIVSSHRRRARRDQDKNEIFAVGHRVVHAGEKFTGTVPITDAVLDALRECIPLAPLHNPPNITGIEAAAIAARRPHGGRLRHRLPPDHARPGLHLPPPLPVLPRTTRSAATASTAPATAT